MRVLPLVALAALVILSGCVGGEPECPPPSATTASTVVPGLYDALGALEARGGPRVTMPNLYPGFGFNPPDLGPGWGQATLELVMWGPERGANPARLLLQPTFDGRAEIVSPLDLARHEETLASRFDAFARNVTTADEATREAWFETFVSSSDERGDRRVILEGGTLRLQDLYEELAAAHGVEPDASSSRLLHVGDWLFWFRFPTRMLGEILEGGEYLQIQTGLRGETFLRVVGVASSAEAVTDVKNAFETWNLPEAPWRPDDFEFHPSPCGDGILRTEADVFNGTAGGK